MRQGQSTSETRVKPSTAFVQLHVFDGSTLVIPGLKQGAIYTVAFAMENQLDQKAPVGSNEARDERRLRQDVGSNEAENIKAMVLEEPMYYILGQHQAQKRHPLLRQRKREFLRRLFLRKKKFLYRTNFMYKLL